jgi:hypothetical protein
MAMRTRSELDYDFFKSMFIIYLTATITLGIGSINAFSRDWGIGIALIAASVLSMLGLVYYFEKFRKAYKQMREKLQE